MESGISPANVFRTQSASGDTNGVAVSGTTTYYSDVTDVARILNPSYQLQWTGTPVGVFTAQASNKDSPILTSDADWFAPPLAIAIVQPAGTASGDFIDLTSWPFRKARLKYVNASGTGVINAFVAGKP